MQLQQKIHCQKNVDVLSPLTSSKNYRVIFFNCSPLNYSKYKIQSKLKLAQRFSKCHSL